MKKVFALLFVLMCSSAAFGQSLYGESCSSGCGIGTNIVVPSISCKIHDSNLADQPIPCRRDENYPSPMPSTVDVRKEDWTFDTVTPAHGVVISGVGLNTSERWYSEADTTLHTHHVVTADHLVPGADIGNAGGPQTYYLGACGTFPCSISDPTLSTYPGPTCTVDGTSCYFNVWTPYPNAVLPMTLDFTVMGHMTATQGHPAEIPILGNWGAGNFSSLTALNTAYPNYTANGLAHANSTAPNGGNYYVSNGTTWSEHSTKPGIYFTTLEVVDPNGVHHTCVPDANGNHDPNNGFKPKDTCGSGAGHGGDIGMAVVPFYAGVIENATTDYRQTLLDSGVGQYYLNIPDVVAPPANPQSTMNIEVYPCNSTCSQGATPPGIYTINAQPALYTDQTSHTPVAGVSLPMISFQIEVDAVTTIADAPPSTFSADTNELAYFKLLGSAATKMCTNPNETYGMGWWTVTQHTWLWVPPSPGDFNEFYTWNYDNGRVYYGAKDDLTKKLDGTAWPAFVPTASYGSSYNTLIVSANGYFYMALNSGQAGSLIPVGAPGQTVPSGAVSFLNIGNVAYWESCIKAAQEPYLNAFVLSGGSGMSQYSLFTGGFDRSRQQTGDGVAKDGTTVTGLFQRAEIDAFCYNPGAPECAPDYGHYGGGFMGGAFSVFSQNAGRGVAYQLDSYATFWRTVSQTGQATLFTGDINRKRAAVWEQNACINYLNFIEHQTAGEPADGLYASNAYPPTLPYMSGLCMEALIEWDSTDRELDPTNSLGLLDDRIPEVLKEMTGYIWTNWWNQTCVSQGICNYSLAYNPKDAEVVQGVGGGGTTNVFFNELTNMVTDGFTYLYARYGGNPSFKLPDGTTYDVASDQMRAHSFDGYNCTTHWFCRTFSDGLWLHGFSGGWGTPKQFGQNYKQGAGNTYQWRTGARPWNLTDLSPSSNPCRDGSNGGNPCASGHTSAFADTFAAYPVQIQPIGNNYGQTDPTFCVNGGCSGTTTLTNNSAPGTNVTLTIGSTTGFQANGQLAIDTGANTEVTTVVSTSPSHHTVVAAQLNLSHAAGVQVSGSSFSGQAQSAIFGITANGAKITFLTYEQTRSSSIGYGTLANNCTTGSVATEDFGFPKLISPAYATVEVWEHQITLSSLLPALNYYIQINTVDMSGNPMSNNCGPTQGNWQGGGANFWTLVQTHLTVTTASLPAGTINQPYNCGSPCLQAAGGIPPYTWAKIAGTLPPGLTVNSDGTITGTPSSTDNGTYSFTVQVTDQNNNTAPANLSIVINSLAVQTSSLPGAVSGVPYNATINATGGQQPYNWSLFVGLLPSGLTLNTVNNQGVISGTPTGVCKTYPVTPKVKDTSNPQQSAIANLSVVLSGCGSTVTVTTTTLPDGVVQTAYTQTQLQATGGTPPYTWGTVSGQGTLPPGLSLSTTGLISGTPTAAGTYPFTVQATDTQNNVGTAQLQIVVHPTQITINPVTAPDGMPGFSYQLVLTASGGDGNYTWSLASGSLPNGLSIATAQNNGVISGTPTTPGSYPVTIQVADNSGDISTVQFTITIDQPITLSPGAGALPDGTVGTAYFEQLVASGGTQPYICSLISGSVPGLGVAANCQVAGVPTTAGDYSITVRATDINGFYTIPDVVYSVHVGTGTLQPRTQVRGGVIVRGTTAGR